MWHRLFLELYVFPLWKKDMRALIRSGIKKDMHFIAIIPNYEVKTEMLRKVLPTQMSYHDAVYQMGRCAAFAKALEIGNMLIVKKACKRTKCRSPIVSS